MQGRVLLIRYFGWGDGLHGCVAGGACLHGVWDFEGVCVDGRGGVAAEVFDGGGTVGPGYGFEGGDDVRGEGACHAGEGEAVAEVDDVAAGCGFGDDFEKARSMSVGCCYGEGKLQTMRSWCLLPRRCRWCLRLCFRLC